MAKPEAQIERINQVSAMARTSWIVLLGYLAFVGVTLLAVQDADFFVPTRQTQLPLVNVAIPTASFFVFAPILAAALYVYLHIILLKLWDAIADVTESEIDGQPLGDAIHRWLVNDWALTIKGGAFVPARPLRAIGNLASFLLIWAAAPLVLFGFWWWSMPAHRPGLTLLLAGCFLVALTAGVTSWQTAYAWLKGHREGRRERPWLWSVGAFLSAFRGWRMGRARVGDPVRETRDRRWRSADVWYVGILLASVTLLRTVWPFEVGPVSTLASADVTGVELVALPDGWRDWETARAAFRETWCRREGLEMGVCGQPSSPDRNVSAATSHDRTNWCTEHGIGEGQPCAYAFAEIDGRFQAEWRDERRSTIDELPKLDLAGRDLRRAIGPNAAIVRANLVWARLEGADLFGGAAGGGEPRRGAAGAGASRRGAAGGGEPRRRAAGVGVPRRGAAGGGEPHRGAAGGGVPRLGAAGGGGPRLGAAGGGGPLRGAAGGGDPRLGAAGGGEPRRGAAGGGGPPKCRFQEIKLGRRIKPGVAGPVCRFSRRARADSSPARRLDRQRGHAAAGRPFRHR